MRYEIQLADHGKDPNSIDKFMLVKEDVCCIGVGNSIEALPNHVRARYRAEIAALNEFLLDHEQILFIVLTRDPNLKRERHDPFQKISIDGELGKLDTVLLFLQEHITERGDGTVLVGRVDFMPYNNLVAQGIGMYQLEILYYFVDEKEQDPTLTVLLRNFYLDRMIEAL